MFKTCLKPVKKFRLRWFKTFKTYGREAPGETWFRMVQGQAKFDYNPALTGMQPESAGIGINYLI